MRMNFISAAVAAAIAFASPALADTRLTGSGASFPFPIYSAWFKDFSGKSDGVTVDYQSKGSGAGIQDFINGVVDFAASDAAMKDEEIAKVKQGVVLLPMTAGEIVLAYNLPGVAELKLPRDVYPDIFLGKITSWNDPRIAAANEGVTLARHADHRGGPFGCVRHLVQLHQPPRRDQRRLQERPRRRHLGAVAELGQDHQGAEERRRDRDDPADARARSATSNTATPSSPARRWRRWRMRPASSSRPADEGGAAALASAEFDSNMRAFITDPKGDDAYPIATFTWMLFYKDGQDPEKVQAIKQMVEYGLTEGQAMAPELGYIPMPAAVIEKVRAAADRIGAGA